MAGDTRGQLIDCALRLFYREGFRNVGLDAVLAEVGIGKTAFYKHFESKDALMLAALEAQHARLEATLREMLRKEGGRAARDQLRAMFDVVEQIADSEDFQGCIFINVAMEFPRAHDPAHQAAVRNKQAVEDLVHEIAERAGAAAPELLAKELCMIMDGAYVGHMLERDAEKMHTARRLAERAIAAHLGETAAPPPGD
ncbi:MAG: TetR/AcrR family transcriptional regulator [Planctomycetota bacterium]|jgi:AcrR family transcriptional regulator